MSNIKQYTITINGIKESADAVDVLNKQLDALEQRIDELNKKGVSVSKAMGGNTSDMTAEQKLAEQINQSYEKRLAMQTELGKELANEKALMKEINAEQKAAAASERLGKGGYGSTMSGMKAELADIKMAMQTIDTGSTQFSDMVQRANELNDKLKEIEQSYGQFGRNVGNYSNDIINSFKQITIQVGNTEMKFGSTKEAIRTLRESIKGMVVNGQEGTDEFNEMSDALHNLEMASQRAESELNDLKQTSSTLDNMLDTMKGFSAIGNVAGGFSNLLGIGGDFEQSIQKLMSLQSILQGIQEIQKQMNTGEGIGGMFSKASSSIDTFVAKITGAKVGLKGLEASSKTATLAVKGLSLALKAIVSAGVMIAIDFLIDKLKDLGKLFGIVDNSADDAIDAMSQFNSELETQNDLLSIKLKQIELERLKGLKTDEEAAKESIDETNKVLREQLDMLYEIAKNNDSDAVFKNLYSGISDENNMVMNPQKLDEFKDKWEAMNKAVRENRDIHDVLNEMTGDFGQWAASFFATAEDTKEQFTKMNQGLLGSFIKTADYVVQNYDKMADGGKSAITQLIGAMNNPGIVNNLLTNLPKLLGDKAEEMSGPIKLLINQIYSIGKSLGIEGAESLKDQAAKLDEDIANMKAKSGKKTERAARATSKKELDIEKEKQQMMLNLMAEGYQKELTRLKYEYQEKEKKYKGHTELLTLAQKEFQKKSKELTEKYAKEQRKAYNDLYQSIFSNIAKTSQMELDVVDNMQEKIRKEAEKSRRPMMYDTIGFYAKILGKDVKEVTDEMYKFNNALSKQSDDIKTTVEDLNKYIDDAIRVSREEGKAALDAADLFLKNEKLIKAAAEMYGKDYDDKKWDEIKNLFGQKNVETFEDLIKYLTVFRVKEQSALETFTENEEDLKTYWGKILKRMDEKARPFIEGDVTLLYGEWMEERKRILDAEFQREMLEIEQNYDKLAEQTSNYYKTEIENTDKGEEYKVFLREQCDKKLQELSEQFTRQQEAAYKKYEYAINNVQQEVYDKREQDLKEYFADMQEEFRDYFEAITSMSDNLPERDAFGFINIKETNNSYNEILTNLDALNNEIMQVIYNIGLMHQAGRVSTEEYKNNTRELLRLLAEVQKRQEEAKRGLDWREKIQDFFNVFQQYYSELSSAVQQVWGELDNLANYNLDLQQDALDKENEALQKKLDEQEEILEKHKERVDDIEGKLQEARGDRKDALIDALNAEIIAQRRAQAEKERLEKEQEKLEDKQKELDYQRDVNDYHSGLRSILFNTSQAIMSAAVNKWPTPAIPLMALATAAGAAQYALAAKQKPIKKAEGGLLEGASHANGGIPVGMTGIEVEGGEYVIRKSSTNENIELLDFINNSRRKLYADDLINFFRNDRQRFIANTAKTRFADGGILDIADNSSFNLGSAFAAYSDRPIYVSVQEIREREADVRYVETIAGI